MPRHEEFQNLCLELDRVKDRVFALSVLDVPNDLGMTALVALAVSVYDNEDRAVDAAGLQEVLTLSGRFGILAIEGLISPRPPYLHLGQYNDALESMARSELLTLSPKLALTEAGTDMASRVLAQ